jgi:nucleoid-associated protein EbfC
MFEQLKMMGQVAALLKDKHKLQEAANRVKSQLAALRVEGQAGQGAVRATASGLIRIVSLEIAPALIAGMAADETTRTLAGALISEATNDALAKAQAQMLSIISKEARELGLPDFTGDLGKMIE